MLRRIFDGLLLALLAWFALTRLDAGGVAVGLVLAAVFVFTGWRIAALWRKYRRLVHELAAAEAAKQSGDPAERARAERLLASRRMREAAEMTLWTGFVMGAVAVDAVHAVHAGGYDGVGSDIVGSGSFGGDMGGGVGGGFDGGGM